MTPLKSYLLRAARDWCLDHGLTPHLIVDAAQAGVQVPAQYVEDGKIVLNINPTAIKSFDLDEGGVRFAARFSGREFFIAAPLSAVLAIYAKENGQGISFPPENDAPSETTAPPEEPPPGKPPRKGPQLKVVK
jgi:stringent starvation protein B